MREIKPYEHKVQYYETDQMGIVHHSNYIRWFEEARTDVFENIGFSYKNMEKEGILCPVLEINAKYRTMAKYSDVVYIDLKIKAYNGVKITFGYVIRDRETGEVRCTGESVHCFLDRDGKLMNLKKSWPEIHEIMMDLRSEE